MARDAPGDSDASGLNAQVRDREVVFGDPDVRFLSLVRASCLGSWLPPVTFPWWRVGPVSA